MGAKLEGPPAEALLLERLLTVTRELLPPVGLDK